jgi:hypothetical protein
MNNTAIIAKIRVYPHPNADNVQLGSVLDYQVVVDKSIKSGDLGVFFHYGIQLSPQFAAVNPELMKYFPKNRVVKTQQFRGEISEGFWIPLKVLKDTVLFYTGNVYPIVLLKLKEKDEFNEIEGVHICNKHSITEKREVNEWTQCPGFAKQSSIGHFRKELEDVDYTTGIVITQKLHGTSQRVGNVEVPIKRSFFTKWFLSKQVFVNLIGSKNIIFPPFEDENHFRYRAALPFLSNLLKHEVVYYEIVGYESYDKPIVGTMKVPKNDHLLSTLYRSPITYSYGCANGQLDIYVYRITFQLINGDIIDYPWEIVKQRCQELNVKHVPELYNGTPNSMTELKEIVRNMVRDQPDPIDSTHPLEGVVIRTEGFIPKFFKEKTYNFKYLILS